MDRRSSTWFDIQENFDFGDCDAVIEDEDGNSSGSDEEGEEATSSAPAHPNVSTSNGGRTNEVYKTENYYCSGVVTSAFDFSEPWEDSEYSFPGYHTVAVSADHPHKAFEKRVKKGGEWRVVHTLCKECFLLDKANEEEMEGFYTSGMTDVQYFRFCRPKHLRREKKLLANKRQRLIAESEPTETEKSPAESVKVADSFLTPVKPRKESSVAQVAASISPVKRSKVAALLKVTADAVLAAKDTSIKQAAKEEVLVQPAAAFPVTSSDIPATPTTSAITTPSRTPKATTLAEIAPQLVHWVNTVRKSLKLSDLKDLCRANALMVSGSKNELLDRVMKCKLHGGPGACPWCKQSKLELTYDTQHITALPMSLKCKHFAYFTKTYCRYVSIFYSLRRRVNKDSIEFFFSFNSYLYDPFSSSYFLQAKTRPQYHAKPLNDTPEGVLCSKGISAGSFLA